MRALIVILCALLASACTHAPEPTRLGLRLAPASLNANIALQQNLRIERGERTEHVEAALEVDGEQVNMVALAMGQRVLSLSYDGHTLTQWRHPMLPSQLRAEDVLEDIQLTYWPLEAVAAALPPDWRVADEGMHRRLWFQDALVTEITYQASPAWEGAVTFENLRHRYRLFIQSVVLNS